VWSGIGGTAVALAPLGGGAVIAALNWHGIFDISAERSALRPAQPGCGGITYSEPSRASVRVSRFMPACGQPANTSA